MRPNDVEGRPSPIMIDRSGATSLVAKKRSKMTGSGFSTPTVSDTKTDEKSGTKPDSLNRLFCTWACLSIAMAPGISSCWVPK